jgi:hypothetical protein
LGLADFLVFGLKKQMNLMIDCIEECKNPRMLVLRWLLAYKRGRLSDYHLCRFINIIYSSGDTCELEDQSISIWMEADTKLTTLLWLIESKIAVPNLLADYDVHLNLPEYSFVIDHEFMNRSLSDIGLCDDSTIHIKPKKTRNRGSPSAKHKKQNKKKQKKVTRKVQSNNGSSSSKKSNG